MIADILCLLIGGPVVLFCGAYCVAVIVGTMGLIKIAICKVLS